jgi:hypothetical protein
MGKKTGQSGQAIIEYVLLLSMILALAGALIASVKVSRDKLWKKIICDVSAPCADCKATDSAKAVLPKSSVKCRD